MFELPCLSSPCQNQYLEPTVIAVELSYIEHSEYINVNKILQICDVLFKH